MFADVNVILQDGIVGFFMNYSGLYANKERLEEGLRVAEAFIANGDDMLIWQLRVLCPSHSQNRGPHSIASPWCLS